jgi:hypothetical protein
LSGASDAPPVPSIRISDSARLDDLAEYLRRDADAVVACTGPDLLLVQIVGSYNTDAMRMVLDLRVRAWAAAQQAKGHPVTVEFVDEQRGSGEAGSSTHNG